MIFAKLSCHLHHHPQNADSTHGIHNQVQPAEFTFLLWNLFDKLKVLFVTGPKEAEHAGLNLPYPIVADIQCFTAIRL